MIIVEMVHASITYLSKVIRLILLLVHTMHNVTSHAVPFFYRVILHLFIKLRAFTRKNTKTFKLIIPTPDHYPLFIEINKPQHTKETDYKIFYNYKK